MRGDSSTESGPLTQPEVVLAGDEQPFDDPLDEPGEDRDDQFGIAHYGHTPE